MRQTILGFNQEKAISLELSINDLLLLQYIMYANSEPNMKHIIDNNTVYVWLNHDKILEDLPILNITDGTLKNKLCQLKSKNLIDSKMISNESGKGSRTYYCLTELTISLLNTTSLKNDLEKNACNSEMTPNNKLNNNINNIVVYDKSYTTTNENLSENLNEILTLKNTNYYKASNKKSINPDNSKAYKNVVEFINNLNYSDSTKEILLKWYNSTAVGKVSVGMLKDKIKRLYESVKTEDEAYNSFNNSYINSWLAFYPAKSNYINNKENNYMYQESKCVTDDMYIKNTDGTFKEY